MSNEMNEDMVRHLVLNSLRSYRNKFKNEYGELIIAMDSKRSWRKDIFPPYKANRKKDRDKSKIDWDKIFSVISVIKQELRDNMPYKIIEVDGAEADDIIGVLCYNKKDEQILIISEDDDFCQLHKLDHVKQYAPIFKKQMLVVDDPIMFLEEHIYGGDSGDGIPNFLSDDNVLITDGVRQTPLTKKKLETLRDGTFEWSERLRRNYERNKQLIDLSNTPEHISMAILEQFENKPNTRQKMLNYFIKAKLRHLMEHISEF